VRVAIVNDLKLAVEALKRTVAQAPGCEVAWVAADGAQAVEKARGDRPDMILMDIVMPVMDGVEATRRIMKESPCPILVVTASMEGNLERVYAALGAGALDAVQGPVFGPGGALSAAEPVLKKIRTLKRLPIAVAPQDLPLPAPARPEGRVAATPATGGAQPVLALGASTGGPEALVKVLKGLSPGFSPPIVIVQHLDPEFVPGLIAWLGGQTGRTFVAAGTGDRPTPGVALVACSEDHLVLAADGALRYVVEPAETPYRPSVDVFFHSLARHGGHPGAAALLTGMGRDGGEGLLALKKAGWLTFAQDEATSVVYGMPRAARELGAASEILPVGAIGQALEAAWRRRAGALPAPGTRR
jgi:two-component system, chemotaxis family, response regulator WspF